MNEKKDKTFKRVEQETKERKEKGRAFYSQDKTQGSTFCLYNSIMELCNKAQSEDLD